MSAPLSPTHPTFALRLMLVLSTLFVPMIISRAGVGTRKQWFIYLCVSVGSLGVLAVLFPAIGFVMALMNHEGAAQRLYDIGGVSLILALCSFFGSSFADTIADRRRDR
jgi:hypothetical protein